MTTLYYRQLAHIFNRPTTEPAWYWSEHWEEGIFEDEEPLSAFVFIEALLQNPGLDLAPYSDDPLVQVFTQPKTPHYCWYDVSDSYQHHRVSDAQAKTQF